MEWSDLDLNTDVEKLGAEARERAAVLAKAYARTFSTDDGKKVLEHLTQRYIWTNDVPFNSPNIMYESGYRAGEAGIVKMIFNQMGAAEKL